MIDEYEGDELMFEDEKEPDATKETEPEASGSETPEPPPVQTPNPISGT